MLELRPHWDCKLCAILAHAIFALPADVAEARKDCQNQQWIVFWKQQEPFADPPIVAEDRPGGIVSAVLLSALEYCCNDDLIPQILYKKVSTETEILETILPNNPSAALFIPATQSSFDHKFVPVIKSPGSIFYQRSEPRLFFNGLLILRETWPLALLFTLLCGFIACAVWLLDTTKSRERFPYSMRGFWNGCWWAYSAGTGSGQNETSPAAGLSQLVGILWMVLSSILFTIFAASLIAGFLIGVLSKPLLRGKTVAVVNGTYEAEVAFYADAIVKVFSRAVDVFDAIEANRSAVDGLLLEFFLAHTKNVDAALVNNAYRRIETFAREYHYGIKFVLGGDGEMLACMGAYIDLRRYEVLKILAQTMVQTTADDHETTYLEATANVLNFLTPKKLGIIAGVLFLTLMISIFWQLCYQKKNQYKNAAADRLHFLYNYFVPPESTLHGGVDHKDGKNVTYASSILSTELNPASCNSVPMDPVYATPQKHRRPALVSDDYNCFQISTKPTGSGHDMDGIAASSSRHGTIGSEGINSFILEDSGLFSKNSLLMRSRSRINPLHSHSRMKVRKSQSAKEAKKELAMDRSIALAYRSSDIDGQREYNHRQSALKRPRHSNDIDDDEEDGVYEI